MRRLNSSKMFPLAASSVLFVALLAASGEGPAARPLNRIPLGLDAYMPIPEDNPLTPEKVALGGKLFKDRILSRDKSISCATCHDPTCAFTDARPVAIGVLGRKGTRRVPVLINRGYGAAFFWDGRATSLEEQVLQPIQNPKELDMSLKQVVDRLKDNQEYRQAFRSAFGAEVNAPDLARALASYVRTILSGGSPVDRYLNGERDALSPEARLGLGIFRGKGNCIACHVGPNFSDEHFHNTGVAWREGKLLDPGRFAVTGEEKDHGAFKTPSLREIARTPPYMHDGSLAGLAEVIEFYNRGGRVNPWLDSEIHPLHLTTEEVKALIVFLHSLSGTVREGALAPQVERSHLKAAGTSIRQIGKMALNLRSIETVLEEIDPPLSPRVYQCWFWSRGGALGNNPLDARHPSRKLSQSLKSSPDFSPKN